METSNSQGTRTRVEVFLRGLPQEGLILHVTRKSMVDSILDKGLLPGQMGFIWLYAFQVENDYYFTDFSATEINSVSRRLRRSIAEGLAESSLSNGLSNQYMLLSPDDYPAVIIARRPRNDKVRSAKVGPPEHRLFTRDGTDRKISSSNILFACTITPQEYDELIEQISSTRPPKEIARTTDPERSYYQYLIGKILGRKVVSELLGMDFTASEETNTPLLFIKRFLPWVHR